MNKLKKVICIIYFLNYSLFSGIFQCSDTKDESTEELKAKIKNHELFDFFMHEKGKSLEQELKVFYNSVMSHIFLLELLSEHEKKILNFKQRIIGLLLSFQELVNKLPLRERHAIHESIFLVNQKRLEEINKNKKFFNDENTRDIELYSGYQFLIAKILREEKIKKQYDIINKIWLNRFVRGEKCYPFQA